MKTIIHRLRRLEKADAPDKWEQINRAIPERIREASFDGCGTISDRIIRARTLPMEREGRIRRKEDDEEPGTVLTKSL